MGKNKKDKAKSKKIKYLENLKIIVKIVNISSFRSKLVEMARLKIRQEILD